MSNPWDDERRLSAARSLTRAALVTRIIGIVTMIGAVLTILTALGGSMSSSDRTGFSLVGLVVLVLGTIVWVNGVFHATVGRFLPSVVALDRKLDRLAELAERRTLPAQGPATAEPAPVLAVEVAPSAEAAAPAPDPAPAPKPVARPVPPEPARTPCPLCGGLIHPEATRCVHCMQKIKR